VILRLFSDEDKAGGLAEVEELPFITKETEEVDGGGRDDDEFPVAA